MDILNRAEIIDQYLSKCRHNMANYLARKGARYELSMIDNQTALAIQSTARNIPLLDECEIVILDETADRGLPHTRPPNYICLPTTLCTSTPGKDFITTLIHEAIHIHQRDYPDIWDRELRRIGWSPVSPDIIPTEFTDRVRINPDTCMKPFWAWDKYHVPLPIFRSDIMPQLNEVNVKWFDTRYNTLSPNAPQTFLNRYGYMGYIEHPYEIYADLYSRRGLKTGEEIINQLSRE
jgi:hypothetical protein